MSDPIDRGLRRLLSGDPRRPGHRTARDWAVDGLFATAGLVFTVVFAVDLLPEYSALDAMQSVYAGTWHRVLDVVAAIAASALMFWRRRWPVATALITLAVSVVTPTGGALPAIAASFTVAVHRRLAVTAAIFAATVAGTLVNPFVLGLPMRADDLAGSVAVSAAVMAAGGVVRIRRQRLQSVRDQATRALTQQQLRAEQARIDERTRIAREMHDVLAHRISLVSLHAGALEVNPAAPRADVVKAAGVIRAGAHQALEDLREVIGVLRAAGDATGESDRPQPAAADVPALVDESRAVGMRVDLRQDPATYGIARMAGRTAYRIVQEGLTNARKHAPGARVTVTVSGAPGQGLTVEVRNPWPVGSTGAGIPGSRTGLIGLTERTTLTGGQLACGRDHQGDFVLGAWLPWPATEEAAA